MPTPQHQSTQPGVESSMQPQPQVVRPGYQPSNKLRDKVAIITGGDSGIGRSVAVHFALEGASIAIVYLNEDTDAHQTKDMIEQAGKSCLLIKGDVSDEEFCKSAIERTVDEFGKIDILVNNAAQQYPQESIENITKEQLEQTFKVNIFAYFYLAKAALSYLKEGSSIINTTSVTAYKGSAHLIDYSATKGAIVAFTRSLSQNLISKSIRVNAVAPGPIWTPLIPASFDEEKVESFGQQAPMQREGQPSEVAPCYVFLASQDASYMTGQVLHPNGGAVING